MDIDWNSLFATWYTWIGSLNSWLAEPVRSLSYGLGVPLVSAFLFGLLGTTAPCQLSTNMGAMAFLARRPSERTATVRATLAYVGAKVLVYTLIGVLVLATGRQFLNAAGPYLDWPRKFVGPLMILLGLVVGGAIRVRFQMGQRLASRLEQKAEAPRTTRRHAPPGGSARRVPQMAATAILGSAAVEAQTASANTSAQSPALSGIFRSSLTPSEVINPGEGALPGGSTGVRSARKGPGESGAPGAWSSFLLGAGFSLAFCPTLFVLFFGATLTLAARSAEGFTFPAVFALGTVLPLVLFVGLALTGSRAAERVRRGMRRANKPLRWVAAALLILPGLHDTFVYWFL